MADRLWRWNPACPDEPCCTEDTTDCGDLCIDMTQGDTGSSVGTGITLNGGTLGTQITDSSGRACFGGIGPGTYSFVASKSGYITNTFDVVVTESDCNGTSIIRSGGNLLPVTPGSNCKDSFLWQCRWCPRPGVTLVFTGPGFSQTVITQFDGRFRLCVPSGYAGTICVTIPGDGGPQLATEVCGNRDFWVPFFPGVPLKISANRTPEWHCLPAATNHCMIPWMDQVTLTFGPTWNTLAGTVHVLLYEPGESLVGEAHYVKDFIHTDGTRVRIGWAYQWEHSNACGNRSHSFGVIQYANGPGQPFHTVQQFTNQSNYGSVICPVDGKYNLVVGGLADESQYVILTE